MFDPNKIIRAIWCIDSDSGDEVLVDIDNKIVLLRKSKEEFVDPDKENPNAQS